MVGEKWIAKIRTRECGMTNRVEYLVTPHELISLPVLETVPDVEELSYAVRPNVISVLFCVIPSQWSPEG